MAPVWGLASGKGKGWRLERNCFWVAISQTCASKNMVGNLIEFFVLGVKRLAMRKAYFWFLCFGVFLMGGGGGEEDG